MISSIFLRKKTRIFIFLFFTAILFSQIMHTSIHADEQNSPPLNELTQLNTAIKNGEFDTASKEFQPLKQWWYQNKQKIKKKNAALAQQIDLTIGQLSVSLLNENQSAANYQQAKLAMSIKQLSFSAADQAGLPGYLLLLDEVDSFINQKDWVNAQVTSEQLTNQWLAVEGDVVAQSQKIYDHSEKNLLLLKTSIEKKEQANALKRTKQLSNDLASVSNHTYTIFDVAMIPFREGLEAILVIALLLSILKRQAKPDQVKRGTRMVIMGSIIGVLTSLAIGLLVTFFLSVVSFGSNQNVINGYAGILSSLMLLYVGIWMHRSSDIAKTTAFYQEKSRFATTSGNTLGLAFLAFLAVVREGLEIVIFLVGMFGKVKMMTVLSGFALGILLLAIIALLFFKFQKNVPLSLFFTVSSLIIIYLAIKFMGSGIHSLQLANIVPNHTHDYLPSNNTFSIYPSWISFAPQLLLCLAFIASLWINRKKGEK